MSKIEFLNGEGAEVKHASNIFKSIIMSNGIEKYRLKEWSPSIRLHHMTDADGWLPIWMLRSDEISIALLGERMWNVAYQADIECIEGVNAINMSKVDMSKPGIDAYTKTKLIGREVPAALRLMLCQHALVSSLELIGNELVIKKIKGLGFYGLNKKLESGDLFPLPTKEQVVSSRISKYFYDDRKSYETALNIDKYPSVP